MPLPELEPLRRRKDSGVELIGASGKSWRERFGTRKGLAPHYNPLDKQVQAAMGNVVRELLSLYKHHPSFGGIALRLGPNTYAQLPEEDWGVDNVTIDRFARDTNRPSTDSEPAVESSDELLRSRWIHWRATVLANWYEELGSEIENGKVGARLYLAGTDMLSDRSLYRPERAAMFGHDFDVLDLLLRMGIDPGLYADKKHVVLLSPNYVNSVNRQPIDIQKAITSSKDKVFRELLFRDQNIRSTGILSFHEPCRLALPSFDELSPFGRDKTQLVLASQIAPTGIENRRRLVHGLAQLDAQSVVEGGWMSMIGQEELRKDIIETYRQLPARPFETHQPSTSGQPVVVRSLTVGPQTFVYVVNDSPVSATVTVDFSSGDYRLRALGGRELSSPNKTAEIVRWTVSLRPYDLIAATLSQPNVKIQDWRRVLDNSVNDNLKAGIDDIESRIISRHGAPRPVAPNLDFEDVGIGKEKLQGWDSARGHGIVVETDRSQHLRGERSLHLVSRQPANWSSGPVVWVRTRWFTPPESGRLAVAAWMRIQRADQQPKVHMLVEGKTTGQTYTVRREIGIASDASKPCPPLKEQWSQYLLTIDDLPRDGLQDLRIGFDLRGTGEVWIDSVEVYDIYLTDTETNGLFKAVNKSRDDLESGKVSNCAQFLSSYWAQMLRYYVPPRKKPAAQQVSSGETASSEPPDVSPARTITPNVSASEARTAASTSQPEVPNPNTEINSVAPPAPITQSNNSPSPNGTARKDGTTYLRPESTTSGESPTSADIAPTNLSSPRNSAATTPERLPSIFGAPNPSRVVIPEIRSNATVPHAIEKSGEKAIASSRTSTTQESKPEKKKSWFKLPTFGNLFSKKPKNEVAEEKPKKKAKRTASRALFK